MPSLRRTTMDKFKAMLWNLCDREFGLIAIIAILIGCLVIQIRDKEAALIAFHGESTSHLDSLKKESERRWEMAGFYTDQLQKEKQLTHAANERHGETLDRLKEGVAKELPVKELYKFVMAP
jgi:hypothetical protein